MGALKWNIDGFSPGKRRRLGIGGVLRDHMSRVLCVFSTPTCIKESSEVEVLEIKRALELSKLL